MIAILQGVYTFFEFWFVLITDIIKAFVRLFAPPGRKSIKDQVALITGAGHGIGRETALELAKHGAVTVLWDINTENNEETLRLVKEAGGKAFADTVDVSNSAKIAEAAQTIRTDIGEVTLLINNAGVINCGRLSDLSEKAIRRTFEVNTMAQFWTVKEFLPSMLDRKIGHIINVSSVAAFVRSSLMTDYNASKGGSHMFTEALRCELKRYNQDYVKVSGVYPIYVETGLLRTWRLPDYQILTPVKVAQAIVDGLLRNRESIYVPRHFPLAHFFASLLPTATYNYLVGKVMPDVGIQYKKED